MKPRLHLGKSLVHQLPLLIDNAHSTIRLAMYQFSIGRPTDHSALSRLYASCVAAPLRGVNCTAVLCAGAPFIPSAQGATKAASLLRAAGWLVKLVPESTLMHTKGIAIDHQTLIIGSHNWTLPGLLMNHEASLEVFDTDAVATFTAWHRNLYEATR